MGKKEGKGLVHLRFHLLQRLLQLFYLRKEGKTRPFLLLRSLPSRFPGPQLQALPDGHRFRSLELSGSLSTKLLRLQLQLDGFQPATMGCERLPLGPGSGPSDSAGLPPP